MSRIRNTHLRLQAPRILQHNLRGGQKDGRVGLEQARCRVTRRFKNRFAARLVRHRPEFQAGLPHLRLPFLVEFVVAAEGGNFGETDDLIEKKTLLYVFTTSSSTKFCEQSKRFFVVANLVAKFLPPIYL